MNQDIPGISSNFNKAMNPQQFDQIVEAILAGKYSWACVLMLRIVGYNPLHYIPYRTYNRLLKENTQNRTHQQHHENKNAAKPSINQKPHSQASTSCLSKIKDLAYLEVVGKQKAEIRGAGMDNYSVQSKQDSQTLAS
ncbi:MULTISPECIES: HetP family heterocyst commitment protein [unclassified Anabaena]|uniref:HetP family heterocyst commitment protein n=1 Tax=unclassified Anabaena TaxID=2619674 RepID=UPI0039C60AA1